MDKEEREFSTLQTDVEILLTICIAFVALAGAFLIAFAQTTNGVFSALTILMALFGIGSAIAALFARKKMDKLPQETPPTALSISDREFQLKMLDTQTLSTNLVSIFSIISTIGFSIFGVILAVTAAFTSGGPTMIVGNLTSGNMTWTGSFTQNATVYVNEFSGLVFAEYGFLILGFVGLVGLLAVLMWWTPKKIKGIRKQFVG